MKAFYTTFFNTFKKHLFCYKEIYILFFLSCAFFYKIILHPREMMYPARDISAVYSFWRSFLVETVLQNHTIPLWNPHMFSGLPFIGDPEAGLFYPFTLLFFIISVNLAFGYLFILDFFLLGVFTYLYCRVIKLEKFSSLISAICMMLSGPFTLLIYEGHLFIADTIIWFPLLLLFYELALQKKKLVFSILPSIPISLMVFAGHLQPAVFGILAANMYFAARILIEYKKGLLKERLLLVTPFITLLTAFCLTAIQVLPSITLSQLSIRSGGVSYEFASDFSLAPKQLISFILPHFFGSPITETYWGKGNFWSLTGYVGIFPLLATLIALLFKRNKYTIIFLLLGIFSVLYSFGPKGPIFPLFYEYIPGFNMFRVQARFLYIYAFSVAVLTGFGVNFLLLNAYKKRFKQVLYKIVIVTLGLSVVVLVSAFLFSTRSDALLLFEKYILKNSYAQGINHLVILKHIQYDFYSLSLFLFFSAAALFSLVRKLQIRYAVCFAVILLDLGLFGIKFYDTKNPSEVFVTPQILKEIPESNEQFRVFDFTGKYITPLSINRFQSLTGMNPSSLKEYQTFLWLTGKHLDGRYDNFYDFYSIENPNILRILNTKYIISNKTLTIPGYKKIYQGKDILYEDTLSLPRAYTVENILNINDKKNTSKTAPSQFISEQNAFKNRIITPDINKVGKNPATIHTYSPNRITLTANTAQPELLVLSEIFYPGWKAYVNGQQTPIYPVNYVLRSIILDEGRNEVSFIYDPIEYRVGRVITLVSLCGLSLYLLLYLKLNYLNVRKRKNKVTSRI